MIRFAEIIDDNNVEKDVVSLGRKVTFIELQMEMKKLIRLLVVQKQTQLKVRFQ